jgi:predicted RNA-binding Zn ribbon-like protein
VLVDGEARLGGEGGLEQVLGAVARLAVRGELSRVKICPADDCRWAFYDTSRNSSRQWCSMAVCGNRAKARAYRARLSPGTTQS